MNKKISNKLSLKEFIRNVRDELEQAETEDPSNAYFELKNVKLEASFTVENTVEGKGSFYVVEGKAASSEENLHKVILELEPIRKKIKIEKIDGSDSPIQFEKQKMNPVFLESSTTTGESQIDNQVELIEINVGRKAYKGSRIRPLFKKGKLGMGYNKAVRRISRSSASRNPRL